MGFWIRKKILPVAVNITAFFIFNQTIQQTTNKREKLFHFRRKRVYFLKVLTQHKSLQFSIGLCLGFPSVC